MSKQKCPYCKEHLEKTVTRKKKCPHCGQDIYVRAGTLLTLDEVEVQDKLRREEAKLQYWLRVLGNYGFTKRHYERQHKALHKQFKAIPSINDVIWRLLNLAVAKGNKTAYIDMSRIALEEGKDPKPYLETYHKLELLDIKRIGFTHVEVNTRNDEYVCGACKELKNEPIPIDEAIRDMPIPRQCTSDRCRCSYGTDLRYAKE